MARKNQSLAQFDEVAIVNNNINVNKNEVNDVNNRENVHDYLDKLAAGDIKKGSNLILTGVYLEPQVLNVLNKYAKLGGRGAKSKIVNDVLKSNFLEKGLL